MLLLLLPLSMGMGMRMIRGGDLHAGYMLMSMILTNCNENESRFLR